MDLILLLKAVILGLVEGATEFIPVSSTGHLIIMQSWLDFIGKKEVAFSIFIQLGAILAVVWLYREKLISAALGWPSDPTARRLIVNLIVGTLPAVVIGVPTEKWIEAHLFKPLPVAIALVVGGLLILLIEKRYRKPKVCSVDDVSLKTALIIGMAQVLAILFPGVSRSGATIMGGLLVGLSRRTSAEFSFFLAIPAMLGASALKLFGARDIITMADLPLFATGFIVACVSALFIIKGLLTFVSKRSFALFAWYRILFGALLILIYWKNPLTF